MTEATAAGDVVSYRTLLRNTNFAALWLGQFVSTLGDRLHQIALLVLVGSLTSNNLSQIGMVWVAIGLPSLLFGLFAGALVDRWSRKTTMVISDLVRVPLVLLIPWLARVDLAWVYVLTFVLTTVGLFFRPAQRAILPDVVPQNGLTAANSFASASETIADVVGYPLAGFLVAGLAGLVAGNRGIDLAFYIDAATYAFSALMIYQVSVSDTRAKGSRSDLGELMRQVGAGLRFVRSNAVLLTNTVLLTLGPLVGSAANTLSYGYAVDVAATGWFYGWPVESGLKFFGIEAGPSQAPGIGYALLEGALGLGSLAGALAVGRWAVRYRKGPTILIGLLLLGVSQASLALFSNLWLAVVMLMVAGAANMLALVPSITLVQERTPGEMLGRVFSLRILLISLAVIVANALAGIGARRYGVQPMFALFGGLLVLTSLGAWLLPSARDAD